MTGRTHHPEQRCGRCLGPLAGILVVAFSCAAATAGGVTIRRVLNVSPVWSGHPVGFCLLTAGARQYAAFYDAERRMTVAQRKLGDVTWTLTRLPEKVGWDSHNYVTMVADDAGYIHLSGNMHCRPLKYFRTARPHDATTFQRIPQMVGRAEKRCTYPRFFRGPSGKLMFTYRDGGSGNGNQIYNVYDVKTKTWRRLLDKPLTDGRGRMNAYLTVPTRGPDGRYHLCWIWRDTPDCSTNHDPSYARSADLVHWETAAGEAVKLPITAETPGLVVDPVPAQGGAINGNVKLGFDSKARPVVSYHKYDEAGKTQVYNARFEDGRWRVRRASNWDYRWDFRGRGTIGFEISISGVRPAGPGRLTQSYRHPKRGSGTWLLDEETLEFAGAAPRKPAGDARKPAGGARKPAGGGALRKLGRPESKFPGMSVTWASGTGSAGEAGVTYRLRWETLGRNRDLPRKPPLPKPSMLRLYELYTR